MSYKVWYTDIDGVKTDDEELEFADLYDMQKAIYDNVINDAQDETPKFMEWDWNKVGMCENCDDLYDKADEILGGKSGKCGFCCDGCRQEAEEEERYWTAENRREAEVYGTDLDSWYR